MFAIHDIKLKTPELAKCCLCPSCNYLQYMPCFSQLAARTNGKSAMTAMQHQYKITSMLDPDWLTVTGNQDQFRGQ